MRQTEDPLRTERALFVGTGGRPTFGVCVYFEHSICFLIASISKLNPLSLIDLRSEACLLQPRLAVFFSTDKKLLVALGISLGVLGLTSTKIRKVHIVNVLLNVVLYNLQVFVTGKAREALSQEK
jgi:hypothetical protein